MTIHKESVSRHTGHCRRLLRAPRDLRLEGEPSFEGEPLAEAEGHRKTAAVIVAMTSAELCGLDRSAACASAIFA